VYPYNRVKRDGGDDDAGDDEVEVEVTSTSSSSASSSATPTTTAAPSSSTYADESDDKDVKTTVISADPRCPYPYPGIYCGTPKTTMVTQTRKPTSTSAEKADKTGSVECNPYPYPGQKKC
jgi:hypothetical protein